MPKLDLNNQGFNEVLTPQTPIQADSSGYVQAAQIEAAGKVAKTKANMELVGDATKQAVDAGKGFLESGLERDIKKTVALHETSVNYDNAVLQAQMLESGFVEGEPADLVKAKASIEKYKAAMDQGTMTRDQAIMAIDKSVKDYSNTMPGFAADFRKLGFQLTGVEHLGARKEFEMLTKQSMAEKLKYDQAKWFQDQQQKMVGDFVNTFKRFPIGGLNGPEMQIYRQQAALQNQAVVLKAQTEVKDQTVAQIEPGVVNYVNTRLADGILTLSRNMQGIPFSTDPRTGKPNPPEDKAVLRQRILSDTNTFFENLKAEVLTFNANQLSNGTREQTLTRLSKQQSEMADALKNQDAFDDMKKTMEIRQAKAQDVVNQWSIANPELVIYQKSGLPTPDLAKFWIDSQRTPQRQSDFVRTYGDIADKFYRSVSQGGAGVKEGYIANMARLSSDPEHLDRLKETDVGAYTVGLHKVRDGIKDVILNGWGQDPQTQIIKKASFANWINGFGRQVDPKRQDLVNEWTKTMSDPNLIPRLMELSPDKQLEAGDAIMTRTRQILENPDVGFMKRLDSLVKEANDNFRGIKYDLVVNPLTKQIELTKTEKKLSGTAQKGQTESVTSPAGTLLGFGEIKDVLSVVNRGLGVVSNVGQALPQMLPEGLSARGIQQDYLAKLQSGYFSLSYDERSKALNAASKKKETKPASNPPEKALSPQINEPGVGDFGDDEKKQLLLHIDDFIKQKNYETPPENLIKLMNDLKKSIGVK